jgi:hypothetical protein
MLSALLAKMAISTLSYLIAILNLCPIVGVLLFLLAPFFPHW